MIRLLHFSKSFSPSSSQTAKEISPTALPETEADCPSQPLDLSEEVLEIVRAVVNSPVVSLSDSFFDVGGHSLLATQMVMRIRRAFGVKVTLRDVFESDTIGDFAVRLSALINLAEIEQA